MEKRLVTDYAKKSSFPYFFAHWCSFQMTALNLGVWKWSYLLHDLEKPFLLIWFKGDYKKVQHWHRYHNKHHLEYGIKHGDCDWRAMVIDNECSRFTKRQAPMTAREWYNYSLKERMDKWRDKYGFKLCELYREKIYKELEFLGL